MCEIGEILNRTKKCAYKAIGNLSEITKLTLAVETHKSKLSGIYEKIGESVVSGNLSSKSGEEKIFKYIDEAKMEKQTIKELCEKRRNVYAKSTCPSCGKSAKKNTYCSFCGKFVK